jgi:hypothetical protein
MVDQLQDRDAIQSVLIVEKESQDCDITASIDPDDRGNIPTIARLGTRVGHTYDNMRCMLSPIRAIY